MSAINLVERLWSIPRYLHLRFVLLCTLETQREWADCESVVTVQDEELVVLKSRNLGSFGLESTQRATRSSVLDLQQKNRCLPRLVFFKQKLQQTANRLPVDVEEALQNSRTWGTVSSSNQIPILLLQQPREFWSENRQKTHHSRFRRLIIGAHHEAQVSFKILHALICVL